MDRIGMSRRGLLKALGAASFVPAEALFNVDGVRSTAAAQSRQAKSTHPEKLRVAAVQMHPRLGDVEANLDEARKLVRQALRSGAKWVILPEFFTSGLAIDPAMLDAHRPLDGEPMEMLKDLAKSGDAVVGGSYLAQSGDDVNNTFVLAIPDGRTLTHDKDFPSTVFESSYFAGGEDDEFVRVLKGYGVTTEAEKIPTRAGNNRDGVFSIDDLNVGTALCWELARYRTARRMSRRVDMVVAGSAWWEADPTRARPDRTNAELARNYSHAKNFVRQAPRRLARMLGVPVVHANFTGANLSFRNHGDNHRILGKYLGESQIIDGRGNTLASKSDGEGVVMAEIEPGMMEPTEIIPDGDEFWIPEMNYDAFWHESGARGRDYYLQTTRPHRSRKANVSE